MTEYCNREMRDGECALLADHRGRCTTVAFYCDSCGMMRRSRPVAQAKDPYGDPVADFCFMCVKVGASQ